MNDEGKSSPDVTKNSNTSEEKGNKAKQNDKEKEITAKSGFASRFLRDFVGPGRSRGLRGEQSTRRIHQ